MEKYIKKVRLNLDIFADAEVEFEAENDEQADEVLDEIIRKVEGKNDSSFSGIVETEELKTNYEVTLDYEDVNLWKVLSVSEL